MSEMKCPICGKDLVEIELGECWFLACCNSKCRCKEIASSTVWEFLTVAIKNRKALSQELIRTGKALDIAKDTIRHADWFFDGDYNVYTKDMHNEIKYAIKAITTLEQKD